MQTDHNFTFGRFRLDSANECLWCGAKAISLRPKAFAVLKLLVERPGQLVTKQQVLDTVWPGTFVSDAVLKDSIRQLREALDDDAESPTYIETAHRRGYRFIAKISNPTIENLPPQLLTPVPPSREVSAPLFVQASGVLGREIELEKLQGWLKQAIAGDRQIIFVTGEAGIGKTTLVQGLLQQIATTSGISIARGQCLEHFGAGEAYMPVLDAFSRLGRGPGGARIVELLHQHAPAWLAQMPSLVPASERDSLQAGTAGATRERMLREIAEGIEAITAETVLVLVLEDLHWSDYSTLDLISYLARRRDPARLMLIGTYRPVEVIIGDHPLKGVKRELQAHGLCKEIPLEYLSEKAIGEYLNTRFPGHQFSRRVTRMIYQRTEGNPLFMVNVLEYLVDGKVIVEDQGNWSIKADLSQVELGVPENLRQLIEKQIERLTSDERMVLEGACVVEIAAGLDKPAEWVDQHCEELARRHQFLSPAWLVELPDGTITPRHKFNHILYLEVPYSLVPPMRRSQIHHRIADAGVRIYGDQVSIIAAELAMHFEQSRDWPLALKYLTQAAQNASHRSAHHEAADLATRGLEVLKELPDSPERPQQEIALRMTLGVSLMAMKGFSAPEVEQVYARARELCWLQGPSPQLFNMLWSLGLYYIFSGEMQSALEIADQLLQLAEGLQDGPLIMEAHRAMGVTLIDLGRCSEGLKHLDQAVALYAKHRNHQYSVFIGHDCKVVSDCYAARALWALGHADHATERISTALELARDLGHPQTLVVAGHFAAQIYQLNGEVLLAQERAKEVVDLADEYGLELWLAFGNINLGWAEVELGEIEKGSQRIQKGLDAYRITGAQLWRPHFLGMLAGALSKMRRIDEGLTALAEALVQIERSGESYSAAELYRIQGELRLQSAALLGTNEGNARSSLESQAQASFSDGIQIARTQAANGWERRIMSGIQDSPLKQPIPGV
jgi:DNA-binding winged helix-turn-helix (wHTH) protein/predicted ATPase